MHVEKHVRWNPHLPIVVEEVARNTLALDAQTTMSFWNMSRMIQRHTTTTWTPLRDTTSAAAPWDWNTTGRIIAWVVFGGDEDDG